MKYKQDEQQTKHDYELWYGRPERCCMVQSLTRSRPVTSRKECNCINSKTGEPMSMETLCFGSHKAVVRYVRKHWRAIKDEYNKCHSGSMPDITHIIALRHHSHGKTPLNISVKRLEKSE